MNRAKAVTSWLLLRVLGYLVNVEASWGQEQLGSRKTLTHYLFAAVAAICIVIHLKERQRTVADLTPTTNWNASLVQVALTRSKTLIVRFFAMFYAIVRRS